MIVFNLSCSQHHHFDGWFRSADDFLLQSERGMVDCPICGDQTITKNLSAPRINTGASSPQQSQPADQSPAKSLPMTTEPQEVIAASMIPNLQAHMLKQFKEFVLTNTENVGANFAETARKMHYGEETQRNIRGRVSIEESMALREEGIETVGLPPGVFMDEGVQ
jgi:hypothetical protein